MRECRDAIAAGRPLPQEPAHSDRPARSCAQRFFFRGLPEAMWTPELNAKLLDLAQTKVTIYDSYMSEMEQMPEDERYLEQHRRSLGSRPIRVLSTGKPWRSRSRSIASSGSRAAAISGSSRVLRAGQVARTVFECQAVVHGQELGVRPV
jgi:hypothetical protein